MSENTELIRKILKSKDLSEQEKVDIIRKIVEDKTTIYSSWPDCTSCISPQPYYYPTVTCDETSPSTYTIFCPALSA